jgi:ribosomal protein S20
MTDVSLEGMSQEAINGLALLAKGLSQNQTTRGEFLRLTKTANPDLNIPEVDIPLQMQGMMEAERKKREDLENKIRETEVRDQIKERRENLMRDKKLSFEQVQEVEKMMTEKGIVNHDTAADFYMSQQKSAAPTPSTGFGVNTVPKIDAKDFGGNIAQWSRNEAANLIGDIRSGKVVVS